MPRKLTTEEFIEKANLKHNNKYIYDKTNYINTKCKIIIKCPIHGYFEQSPNEHLSNKGCLLCGINVIKYKLSSDTKEFIQKSIKIHDNKYIYGKVEYISNNTKVKIECKSHGIFEQTPHAHLNKQGCIKCAGNFLSNSEEFIRKSKLIHGNKYDYNKVIYKNSKEKITIACLIHGEFNQTPNCHLNGQGCPKCNRSKGEIEIEEILTNRNINFKNQYKFDNLRYINALSFDFGILDNQGNLLYLIEFNGKQHYIFDNFFHGTFQKFETYKIRDKIKEEFCFLNKIPLFIIKYGENIENEMYKILFSC